jgi:predicted phage tail protein
MREIMKTIVETLRNWIGLWLLLCLPLVSAGASSYTWQEYPYSWWDNTWYGTEVTGLGDDHNFGPYDLGFEFPFYGQYFSQVRLSENGWVSFTSSSSEYINLGLPSSSMPENLVAPFFDDLDFRNQGSVYVSDEGNIFVITWVNAQHYNRTGGPFTFQAILYANGEIIFQYQDVATLGYNVTVGVQNSTRTDGLQVFYGDTDGTAAPAAGRAFLISLGVTPPPPLLPPTSVDASDGLHTEGVFITWTVSAGADSYQIWRSTSSSSATATYIGNTYLSTYNDTTTVAGTTYYYWVKAANGSGTSDFSNPDAGYRKPALPAPTGVVASDGTYSDKVRVSWSAVSGATSYEVWRSISSSSASATVAGTAATTTFDDTTTTANTTYYYWIKALNASGSSLFSASNTGYRVPGPPAPSVVTASDGGYTDKVRVNWSAVSGATSYEVWRSTANTPASAGKVGSTTSTSYNDLTAVAGSLYYYWIKTVSPKGASVFSASDAGYRLAPPPTPIGVAATDGTYADRVRVTWTVVTGAASYEVWRSTANSANTASKIGSPSGSPWDDTTAVAGTTYYYWVKAKNLAGTSGFSGSNSGYKLAPLAPPNSVAATDGTYADKVQVTWSSVTGANGYEIWRNTVNNSKTANKIGSPTVTPFNDLNAVAGTTYYYWVKTINAAGAGALSGSNSGYRLAPPAAPVAVAATDGTYGDKARVTWNSVSGATSYQVWRSTANNWSAASQVGSGSASPYDDTTATPGTTYYYWVKALNAAGPGAAGGPDSGYRLAPPGPPAAVTATDGTYADKVQVSWNKVTGATSYEVWRNTANNSTTANKAGSPTASPYNDASAAAGTTYYYWIKAVNAAGAGAFSSPDSGYRLAPPAPPTGVTATDGSSRDKIQVTWAAVTGATGYEVWRNTEDNSSSATKLAAPRNSPYDDNSAARGKTYYYWVKAKNALLVSGFSASDTGCLSVEADAYEPDNSAADAKSLTKWVSQDRSIHALGDIDWAKVAITESGTVLHVEASGASEDTEMWVYGPDSSTTQIAYNDDKLAHGKFSMATLCKLSPGTYYLKVRAYGNASLIPAYTLQASWATAQTALAVPNDTWGQENPNYCANDGFISQLLCWSPVSHGGSCYAIALMELRWFRTRTSYPILPRLRTIYDIAPTGIQDYTAGLVANLTAVQNAIATLITGLENGTVSASGVCALMKAELAAGRPCLIIQRGRAGGTSVGHAVVAWSFAEGDKKIEFYTADSNSPDDPQVLTYTKATRTWDYYWLYPPNNWTGFKVGVIDLDSL